MTAQPNNQGPDSRIALNCDSCGTTRSASNTYLTFRGAWLQLWQRAANEGWLGTDQPTGPHHCPACVPRSPA
jgi:hypothetical protein